MKRNRETYNKNLNSRGVWNQIRNQIGNDIDFSVNLINANKLSYNWKWRRETKEKKFNESVKQL